MMKCYKITTDRQLDFFVVAKNLERAVKIWKEKSKGTDIIRMQLISNDLIIDKLEEK